MPEEPEVVFMKNDKEYTGLVLACEKNYFWLLVPDLKEVYVGHPKWIFERNGNKYFFNFDHRQSVDAILEKGAEESFSLCYSADPEKIFKLLNVYKLTGVV